MPTKTTKPLDEKSLSILRRAQIDEHGLSLPSQLDRDDYVRLDKYLKMAGVHWSKQARRHLFATPAAFAALQEILGTGKVQDVKNEFQAFYTPEDVAARLVAMADIVDDNRCLEPSAGHGALADYLRAAGGRVDCIELQEEAAMVLLRKGHRVQLADFLEWRSKEVYDRIVMNPPFTNGQDMAHVEKAFRYLNCGRRSALFAIVSKAFTFGEQKKKKAFRQWFYGLGGEIVEELPAGTFRESGTDVPTCIIRIPGQAPE